MSLIEELKKNSTIKLTEILEDSKLFNKLDMISTSVPALNVALSGKLDGGFSPGLTLWCGPSKHFKTSFSLIMAKAYLDKFKDAVLIFYDSEFGSPSDYFKSFGIDSSRVLHVPITNVEELKFDITKQLEAIKRTDNVIIVIDSIGNLASLKEMEDAKDGKSVADMTRAKSIKSLFRIITPSLVLKNIPVVAVNHVYQTNELFSKTIVSGGTGIYLSSSNIFIIGRQQEKDGTDIIGYNFIINVEKSRYTREKSKIPICVSYDGGISKWSGLIEMAQESGHVIKPSNGWYSRMDKDGVIESKKWRLKETNTKEFWGMILTNPSFHSWVESNYKLTAIDMMNFDDEKILEDFDAISTDIVI